MVQQLGAVFNPHRALERIANLEESSAKNEQLLAHLKAANARLAAAVVVANSKIEKLEMFAMEMQHTMDFVTTRVREMGGAA